MPKCLPLLLVFTVLPAILVAFRESIDSAHQQSQHSGVVQEKTPQKWIGYDNSQYRTPEQPQHYSINQEETPQKLMGYDNGPYHRQQSQHDSIDQDETPRRQPVDKERILQEWLFAQLAEMQGLSHRKETAPSGIAQEHPYINIVIEVISASNLPDEDDLWNYSDPYVVVQIQDHHGNDFHWVTKKTTIKEGTANPVWKEKLEFRVRTIASTLAFEVRFQVWDDDNNADDCLIPSSYNCLVSEHFDKTTDNPDRVYKVWLSEANDSYLLIRYKSRPA